MRAVRSLTGEIYCQVMKLTPDTPSVERCSHTIAVRAPAWFGRVPCPLTMPHPLDDALVRDFSQLPGTSWLLAVPYVVYQITSESFLKQPLEEPRSFNSHSGPKTAIGLKVGIAREGNSHEQMLAPCCQSKVAPMTLYSSLSSSKPPSLP